MKKNSLYLSLIFLAACTENTFFHSYKPLPAEGWERRDTICFELPQQTDDISGTLTIGLRTKTQLNYRDIVLAVEQRDEEGSKYRCDTIRCPLTDAEGDAIAGGVNIHQYETQSLPIILKKGQRNTIRIYHLMRRETMPGITDLGIKLDKNL